ncbi:PD-(D/E)XK motif protein [Ruegeria atlantica]|uniref:PD-(D/E)XK motif protein n=1 Tax=Ruegeria atlantica TaxID=81569 RepID=UPI002494A5F5|nr:PD-(D/E)XK motif protein [Ruegeria atlantica]
MNTWTERGIDQIWDALSPVGDQAVWRVSVLAVLPEARLLAGRIIPGNREAILVKLSGSLLPAGMKLPQGSGFDVLRVAERELESGEPMLALVRSLDGASDLFRMMAVDVLRHVEGFGSGSPKVLLEAFLSRVTDWQTFMSADRAKPLTLEKQAGLQGELEFLDRLLDITGNPQVALDMWQGPFRAAQDFHVGNGAVEVKSTASVRGFKARINSIEQLDTIRTPMFLMGVRFVEDPDGVSLRGLVAHLRARMGQAGSRRLFEAILFACRYFEDHEPSYERPLTVAEMSCFPVDEAFPCLRRTSIPMQISAVKYDLDLATIEAERCTLNLMLERLGVK